MFDEGGDRYVRSTVCAPPSASFDSSHAPSHGYPIGAGCRTDLLGMIEPPLMAGCTATAVRTSISSSVTVISVVLSAQPACGRYLPYRAPGPCSKGCEEVEGVGG